MSLMLPLNHAPEIYQYIDSMKMKYKEQKVTRISKNNKLSGLVSCSRIFLTSLTRNAT